MFFEVLEHRALLSASPPTALEQYFIEVINRARANPTAEAKRFGIDLNEGLSPGTLSAEPRQPLAVNALLVNSARKQAKWQLDPTNPHDGQLDHLQNGANDPCSRNAAEGYSGFGCAENLAWTTHSASTPTIESTDKLHTLLFKDFTANFEVAGRGHRKNILKTDASEIGIGLVVGKFGGNNGEVGAQSFGTPNAAAPFVTGVVYTDKAKDDDFYTVGEGLGNISITATRRSDNAVFSTKTFPSGGYSLQLEAGVYTVTAAGRALGAAQSRTVALSNRNVKQDFIKPGGKDLTGPTALLNAGALTNQVKQYSFEVIYNDATKVKASSVGDGDVQIIGPGNKKYTAAITSATSLTDASSIVATYTFHTAKGFFSSADNGTYTVKVLARQITDAGGKASAAEALGSFAINIP